ncbi:MAG: hypothetical protein IJ747_08055 [Lachnospiraceae bacterium]|nr:hypothetical protein [Lachnospiraceae bacterium]
MQAEWHVDKKRILYTVCFFLFCLIDQRIKTGSGLDGQIETFRALTGVGVAVLTLTGCRMSRVKAHKALYLVWSLLSVIGGAFFVARGQQVVWFGNARAALAANVLLWGNILLYTISGLFGKERYGGRQIDRRFACAWLVMMGLMCVSRSTYHWPAMYLVMFGCFYLMDYERADLEKLFLGMLDGVILAFFILQGWCFVFRPYDEVRYVGVYNNCNLNALFYLTVLAAVLAKLLLLYAADDGKAHRLAKLFYMAGVGALFGFLFLTVSRTGWMTMVVLTFVGLLFLQRLLRPSGKLGYWCKSVLLLALCFCLTFPAVFGATRYLPPLFHHPVWFFGEWSEDKVHSWDPWDSEKFVDLDELMAIANKRVAAVLADVLHTDAAQEPVGETDGTAVELRENQEPKAVSEIQQQLYDEALAAGYAFPPGVKAGAVQVRKAIYRYYIHLLNLTGHPESEEGFQMTATHRIGHAHNIYLQWGVDFGVPAMLLLIVLVIWTIGRFAADAWKSRSVQSAGYLLFFLVPCIFGMLEYAWGAGSVTITMLFVAWRRMIRNED